MNNYRLKKWYPSLPKDWEVGDIVTPYCEDYFENKKTRQTINSSQVIDQPEFWEKVEEWKPKEKPQLKSPAVMRIIASDIAEGKITNKEKIIKEIEEQAKNGYFEHSFRAGDLRYANGVKTWLERDGYRVKLERGKGESYYIKITISW
jgi:hypothetical protein